MSRLHGVRGSHRMVVRAAGTLDHGAAQHSYSPRAQAAAMTGAPNRVPHARDAHLLGGEEDTGRLDNVVGAAVAPWDVRRVPASARSHIQASTSG